MSSHDAAAEGRPLLDDRACVALLQWAAPRLGLRWEGFRRVRGQVCKRLRRRMQALGVPDALAYRALLERDPDERAFLDGCCRISITRFYRDRAVFERLGTELARPLAEARARAEPLRLWSAGCAAGEEPYSLLLLATHGLAASLEELEIIATDADRGQLERARRACYAPASLRELPRPWVAAAFEARADELCLRPELRGRVDFRLEDLRERMPDGPFDAVLCRNLAFTYFEPALQRRILERLLERLRPGGLLVLGAHERLPLLPPGLETAAGALPLFRWRAAP